MCSIVHSLISTTIFYSNLCQTSLKKILNLLHYHDKDGVHKFLPRKGLALLLYVSHASPSGHPYRIQNRYACMVGVLYTTNVIVLVVGSSEVKTDSNTQ